MPVGDRGWSVHCLTASSAMSTVGRGASGRHKDDKASSIVFLM